MWVLVHPGHNYVNVSGFMGCKYCKFLTGCYKTVALPTELVTTRLVTTHNPRIVQTLQYLPTSNFQLAEHGFPCTGRQLLFPTSSFWIAEHGFPCTGRRLSFPTSSFWIAEHGFPCTGRRLLLPGVQGFFFSQFCDVAEVVIIHKMIQPDLVTYQI